MLPNEITLTALRGQNQTRMKCQPLRKVAFSRRQDAEQEGPSAWPDAVVMFFSSSGARQKGTVWEILGFFPLCKTTLLGGEISWGHYDGSSWALLPLSGGAVWVLPVFPTILQLILPFGWAALMAAIYFLRVLRSLFVPIHVSFLAHLRSFSKALLFLMPSSPLWLPTWLFPLLW